MEKTSEAQSSPCPAAPDRADALEKIGLLWDEGIASGPAFDGQEAFESMRRKLKAPPLSGSSTFP